MFDKTQYHPKWSLIVRLIRRRVFNEHGIDCCEGSPRHPDCRAINYAPHPVTGTRVVLTTAHLDHNRSNNRFTNLKRLCQRCHLAHDLNQHITARKYGRNHDRDHQIKLFTNPYDQV